MAKKVEISVEEKLRALFDLQLIDSRIDEIRSVRGELPLEVEDLENVVVPHKVFVRNPKKLDTLTQKYLTMKLM